jgi:two-component system response regulator MprA
MTTILVVDDDDIARKNISAYLTGEGYGAEEAADGIEALDKLKTRTFDLVLSDIVMPRMDGLELIEQVRSTWPRMRIIAMTAYFRAGSEERFSVAGADGFIRKPIVLSDLLSKIQSLLQDR